MIGVGIIAAGRRDRARWLLPAIFMVFLGVGAVMGAKAIDLPYFEVGITLPVAVFGAIIAYVPNLSVAIIAGLTGALRSATVMRTAPRCPSVPRRSVTWWGL